MKCTNFANAFGFKWSADFHRLPAVIHLLVAGASLLVMASVKISNVICIVISKAMKTQDINTTNQRTNRLRLVMMVTGIAIAILCSLALVYEAQQMEHDRSVNEMIETSTFAVTDFSIQFAGKAVVSILWPF